MNKTSTATPEDWMILGMVRAFRAMNNAKNSKTENNLNDVNFEVLIEVQKRNLSNPKLIDLEKDMSDYSFKMGVFK